MSDSRQEFLHTVGFFLATIVLCWTYSLGELPLLVDNQHYFFMAERAASGVPPHVSHFDPKNALSILISAVAIAAGRWFGIDDIFAARIISIVFAAAAIASIWLLAKRLSGRNFVGTIAATIALRSHRYLLMAAMGARPKVFLVFFVVWSFLAVGRRQVVRAGAVVCLAFLCWQPALLLAPLALVALLVSRPVAASPTDKPSIAVELNRWVSTTCLFVSGFFVPLFLYGLYFALNGALDEYLFQAYQFPAEYMTRMSEGWGGIRLHALWILRMKNGVSLRTIIPAIYMAAVIGFFFFYLFYPERWYLRARQSALFAYFTSAAPVCLLFSLVNFQGFPDRFFIEPFIVTLFAWVVSVPLSRLGWSSSRETTVAWIGAVIVVAIAFVADGYDPRTQLTLGEQKSVAREVGSRYLDQGKSVYALGCTHLLAFNHVDNYVKYGFFFRGVPRFFADHYGGNARPIRNGKMPDVILYSRARKLPGRSWVTEEYVEVPMANSGRQGFSVLERRSEAPDQSR